jgi:Mce-associated membrane protein
VTAVRGAAARRLAAGAVARRLADPLVASAAALVLVAAVFAGWAGWSWYSAAHGGGDAALSQVRDQALQDGEQAIQNFNTIDYRTVAQGISLWEQSSTGALRSQVAASRAGFEREVRQARTVTSARILDGALTALDAHAGTATIITAVQLTVIPATGSPAVKQERLTGQLIRTRSGWKLSSLGQVPVGAAG